MSSYSRFSAMPSGSKRLAAFICLALAGGSALSIVAGADAPADSAPAPVKIASLSFAFAIYRLIAGRIARRPFSYSIEPRLAHAINVHSPQSCHG